MATDFHEFDNIEKRGHWLRVLVLINYARITGCVPAWKYWQDDEQKPQCFLISVDFTVSHHPCLLSHVSRLKHWNDVSPSLISIIEPFLKSSFFSSGTSFSASFKNFSHSDSGGRSGGYLCFSHAYFPFESIRFCRN